MAWRLFIQKMLPKEMEGESALKETGTKQESELVNKRRGRAADQAYPAISKERK
jgi:hypothetical protein